MKRLLSILFIVLAVSSCDLLQISKPLEDSRFNGDFSFFHHWEDADGIEETTTYTSITFDGTSKAWFYSKYSSYYISSGWSYSGDYLGDYFSWDLEFEVSNGLYRERLWQNSYDDWSDWKVYEFINNNQTLILFDYYGNGVDLNLTKDT